MQKKYCTFILGLNVYLVTLFPLRPHSPPNLLVVLEEGGCFMCGDMV